MSLEKKNIDLTEAIRKAKQKADELFKNCSTIWRRDGDLLIPTDRETGMIRQPEKAEN